MLPRNKVIIFLYLLSLMLQGCKRPVASVAVCEGDTLAFKHAQGVTVVRQGGCFHASVSDPFHDNAPEKCYTFLHRDSVVPENYGLDNIIRIPVERVLVFSTVHTGLISWLGKSDAIAGICDALYITTPEVREGIENGSVVDCGTITNPDLEKIAVLNPDLIMLSPYQNSDVLNRVKRLGIPVLECADYMEQTPLGRAEWMRFYGLIFGCSSVADSLFNSVESRYLQIRDAMAGVPRRPRVILDGIYAGVWNVPACDSPVACMIRDAGGCNPFDYISGKGSRPLTPEKVYEKGSDADFWFVRYNSKKNLTLADFKSENRFYPRFKAVETGDVYGCNTAGIPYYDEVPFHPDRLLSDLVSVMHPSSAIASDTLYYFKPMR